MRIHHHLNFKKLLLIALSNLYKNQGFNLLELLIVTIIVGILAAIAFPNLWKQIDKARHTEVVLTMDCIADNLRGYYMERGYFPKDVSRNQKPLGISCLPISSEDKIPFDSTYDYESWEAGAGKCYIQITFMGKNKTRNSPTNQVLFPKPGIYDSYRDDLIMSLGIFDVPCQ